MIDENGSAVLSPTKAMAAMQTKTIKATSRVYSTRPAPRSCCG